MKIEGITSVLKKLEALKAKGDNVSVIVGYTAKYSLAVHENLKNRHGKRYNDAYIRQEEEEIKKGKNKGKKRTKLTWTKLAVQMGYHYDYETGQRKQPRLRGENQTAKFLEIPARKLKKEFQRIIQVAVKKGATLEQALIMVGLRLQRESQLIVPVDTGGLKASAFTKVEK